MMLIPLLTVTRINKIIISGASKICESQKKSHCTHSKLLSGVQLMLKESPDHFFHKVVTQKTTVNVERCGTMITEFFLSQLVELGLENMWF